MARGYTLTQTGSEVQEILNDEPTKQDELVSGENIKTINNQSILGPGNISVVPTTRTVNGKALNSNIRLTAGDVGAYVKPDDGIPGSDLASDVIPDVSQFITKSVDDLVNYYTKSQTYTQAEVQQLINAVKQFTYESVSTLPTASSSTMNKIYLVPSSDPQTQNVKDEYITIQSGSTYSWEQIGSTAISLDGYVTTTALNSALANYTTTADLNTLLAGYQTKIGSNHKLSADLVDDDNTAHKFVTETEKTAWNNKQDALESGTNIKTLNGKSVLGAGNLETAFPVVNHGTSDTTYTLPPNTLHVWGTVVSLTLTLATPTDNTIVNEYMIEFVSGSTATTLSLPSSVDWAESCGALSVEASKTYQISIVNNIGLWIAV